MSICAYQFMRVRNTIASIIMIIKVNAPNEFIVVPTMIINNNKALKHYQL